MTNFSMATPVRFTDLRHVRKTVAFDGTAGNGAVGTVDVFTLTGRIWAAAWSVYCTEDLVGAGTLAMGTAGATTALMAGLADATTLDAGKWWDGADEAAVADAAPMSTTNTPGKALDGDVILTVGSTDITDGTIVIDLWYMPITDDGALAAA